MIVPLRGQREHITVISAAALIDANTHTLSLSLQLLQHECKGQRSLSVQYITTI